MCSFQSVAFRLKKIMFGLFPPADDYLYVETGHFFFFLSWTMMKSDIQNNIQLRFFEANRFCNRRNTFISLFFKGPSTRTRKLLELYPFSRNDFFISGIHSLDCEFFFRNSMNWVLASDLKIISPRLTNLTQVILNLLLSVNNLNSILK